MRVADIMCRPVETCTEETSLVSAARKMFENDCGILPVVANGRLTGVITDRDVCVAVGTRGRPPADLIVRDVMSRHPVTCRTTDEIGTALRSMAARLVRRLPVLDPHGDLAGIISLDDVVLRAEVPAPGKTTPEISDELFVRTLRTIAGSRSLLPHA